MTNEEAIKKLVNAEYADEFQGDEELQKAQHMAIEALNFQDKIMKEAKLLLSSDYNERHCKMFWIELINGVKYDD